MTSKSKVYDVGIVGGGIMGSCAAAYASKNGSTLLVEQFSFLHRKGSSHGDSRIVREAYPLLEYTQLAKHSFDLWFRAERDANTKVITLTGGLDFARQDNRDIQALQSTLKQLEVPHRVLSSSEVTTEFPLFQLPENYVGIHCPKAGIVDATGATSMFQSLARDNGADLRSNTEIIDIVQHNENILKLIASSGEEFLVRKLIVTAGAWLRKILRNTSIGLGIETQPIQTTVSFWKCDASMEQHAKAAPIFLNYQEPLVYGFPMFEKPGHVKVCLHNGPKCDPDDRDFIPRGDEVVAEFIRSRMSGISDSVVESETCMYTMTCDHECIIDFLPSNSNIIIAGGFCGMGFKLGPIVGKIVSDLAAYGYTTEDISRCSIRRAGILSPNSRI